jgi:membrane-bound serine protease (ClpP class)
VIRLAAIVGLLAALLGASGSRAATVYVATVSGGINPAVSDYLKAAILEAESKDASALVIELDTPGGLLSSTKDIVSAILNAGVPVVVFVSPRGAWAGSAGTFITLAGHVAAMAPGTTIGAAHPVSFLPGGTPPAEPEKPGEEGKDDKPAPAGRDIAGEKIENVTAAFIESIARERKRNVDWAIRAVRNSEAIDAREAVELNVVDLVAQDLDHLLEQIDGRSVAVGRDEVVLETKGASVERIDMSLVNRFFDVISDPQIAMLLILAGLLGLYVEFTQPGTIFPGVAGAVSLVLAALALQIIPFNWLGLILILAGIGLLVAELFVTSFGLLFGSGVVCLAIGGYVLFDVPEQMDIAVPFWQVVVPAVAMVALFGAIIVFGVGRSMARPAAAGAEGLVGELGVVESGIGEDPSSARGRVRVRGEYWTAAADRPIAQGERVRIVAVEQLVLRVAPEADSAEGAS